VGTGVETSGQVILDTALEVAGLTGQVEIIRRESRPADLPRHFAAVQRLAELGVECRRPLEASLRDVIDYYLGPVEELTAAGTASGRTDHNERIELRIRRDDSYSAEVGVGILDRLPTLLATRFPDTPVAVLTDDRVAELYGSKVAPILARAGIDPSPIIVPSGERSKTPATAEHVVEQLYRARFDRRSVLVNFGGGMITDLGGFVASTYLRGVAYVNVPTTLLSQHDSAIGGKVGVDTPWAKNFLGAFHHPCAVYCDPSVLQTLPIRELRSGLAESVKVAICGAPGLFEFLEDHAEQLLRADTALLEELVGRSIRGKVDILDPDPYEVDLRRSLNLGHTFGHALEVELGFAEVTHGEAVAHGLAVATMIGDALGLCRSDDVERIMALLDRFGLPPAIDEAKLKAAAKRIDDVRLVRAGQLNYVVPTSTHSVTILPTLSVEDVTAAIDAVGVFTRTARPADPAGSAAADG
jgi:3-dehydroquinate synthase